MREHIVGMAVLGFPTMLLLFGGVAVQGWNDRKERLRHEAAERRRRGW